LRTLIIHQAEIESSTHTSDQTIQFLAFLIFSSSPQESIYIIPESINVITATTATYCIRFAMVFESQTKAILVHTLYCFGFSFSSSVQPGRPIQFTVGAHVFGCDAQKVTSCEKRKQRDKNIISIHFFTIFLS
jgi:hypothetical protein